MRSRWATRRTSFCRPPPLLSFLPGSTTPLTFTLTAPPDAGSVTLSYALNGSDAAHFVAPSPALLTIDARGSLLLSGAPAALAVAEVSAAMSLTLSTPTYGWAANLTVSIECVGGSAVPAQLVWPAATSGAQSFLFTAGSSVGFASCAYLLSGDDAAHFNPPNASVISIVERAALSVLTLPSEVAVLQSSLPVQVQPLALTLYALTVQINCSAPSSARCPALPACRSSSLVLRSPAQ
jgi:hypothetical protein